LSQIIAAALLGVFTIIVMATPAEKLTRKKIEAFAELDKSLAIEVVATGSIPISPRSGR
jgi:hypothetical protein